MSNMKDTFELSSGRSGMQPIAKGASYALATDGLELKVVDYGESKPTMRSESGLFDQQLIEQAVGNADAYMMRTFQIDIQGATQAKMSTRSADGSLEMTAPARMHMRVPSEANRRSVLLHEDETGFIRWVLPERRLETEGVEEFVLPQVPVGRVHRGPVTQKIRRIVKVISWVADQLVGELALNLVRNWEQKHRPYGLLGYEEGKLLDGLNVDRLRGGKSLLLLHGTFSTASAAFAGMLQDHTLMRDLETRYQGRIFAFNHPSLHVDPAGNIQQLIELLPPELRSAEVDLVTHSRGGLVGRELIAQSQENKGPGLLVDKAIFVAGPHRGTIMTDRDHWIKLIDTYTNLISKLPDNVVTIILEALVSLIKVIGGSTLHALPGLQAMLPTGDYIEALKDRPLGDTRAYTMSARYLPMGDNLVGIVKSLATKLALRKIFGEDSDMVVPTSGALSLEDGSLVVPAERQLLYNSDSMINHVNFFHQEKVNRQITNWLVS